MKKKFLLRMHIATLLLAIFFMWQASPLLAYASESHGNENYYTVKDDFTYNHIIVVLTKEATRKFSNYSVDNFSEIDCKKVDNLTKYTSEWVKKQINNQQTKETMLVDIESYRKILKLELKEKNKENVLKSIEILKNRNDIYTAEPDYFQYLQSVPNDPYYSNNQQWGLTGGFGINAPNAWNITTGSSDVLVGVLDTGIDGNHPDLINRMHRGNPHTLQTTLHKDFVDGSSNNNYAILDPVDPNGHGSHVAGIIGAQGNNGIGISGVAWNIKLVSLRVFNPDPNISTSPNTIEAINFASSNNIKVLNYSNCLTKL